MSDIPAGQYYDLNRQNLPSPTNIGLNFMTNLNINNITNRIAPVIGKQISLNMGNGPLSIKIQQPNLN